MSEHQEPRLLRRPDVEAHTGLSAASIYRLMKTADFPRPVKTGKRAVAWHDADVDAWISSRETAQ